MPQRQLTTYQAVIAQARAYRSLKNFIADNLNDYGLTMTEWLLIGLIIDNGKNGVRITALADMLGVELPVVTNLVNKAVNGGWVKKVNDIKDKRAKLVRATYMGINRSCDIESALRWSTAKWLEGVDAEMLKGYFTVIGKLSKKE